MRLGRSFGFMVLGTAIAVSACSGDEVPELENRVAQADYDLAVTGESSEPDGTAVHAVVYSSLTRDVRVRGKTQLAGGKFAFSFDRALAAGSYDGVAFWIDKNGDGACTFAQRYPSGGGDKVWRNGLGPITEDMAIDVGSYRYGTRLGDMCSLFAPSTVDAPALFDLNVTASGFEVHDGASAHVLVSGSIAFGATQVAIAGGRFDIRFHDVLASLADRGNYFVDVDHSGKCEDGIDITGTLALPTAGAMNDTSIELTPVASAAGNCWWFNRPSY